jgi:hypothetical protein
MGMPGGCGQKLKRAVALRTERLAGNTKAVAVIIGKALSVLWIFLIFPYFFSGMLPKRG